MELKDRRHTGFEAVQRNIDGNPFNGIERSHDFLELSGYSLDLNPFNGIESDPR